MRVAMLGGTFDPVHIGHLIGAQAAWEQLNLDRVLLVPAASPPHKQQREISSAEHRVEMLKLAIAGDERMGLYLEELKRPGRSFTVDTLREFREREMSAGDELFFILGTDNLVEFDTWKDWREICRLAGIAVLNRQGYDTDPAELENQLQGIEIHWVKMPLIGVSATQIRSARSAGASIRYLVTPAVEDYIFGTGLYTGPSS